VGLGFELAKQVLYCLSHAFSPFCYYFGNGASVTKQELCSLSHIPSTEKQNKTKKVHSSFSIVEYVIQGNLSWALVAYPCKS
jgi:hypothetical protein